MFVLIGKVLNLSNKNKHTMRTLISDTVHLCRSVLLLNYVRKKLTKKVRSTFLQIVHARMTEFPVRALFLLFHCFGTIDMETT